MSFYKTKSFTKWATAVGLIDSDLLQAANEVIKGLVETNLGGGLYKKRVALTNNKGKSGGSRTLLAFKAKGHTFYLHGFEKNEKSNISKKELKALKKAANKWLSLTDKQLLNAIDATAIVEVFGE